MSDTPQSETAVTITVNGQPVVAEKGELVIAAAERAGVYIPHFCYHPRMKPVGMCRMCIVDIDSGRGPALQPSCMIEVAPDMVVNTESDATKKAQDGVLEFLLLNHPLDCPVCDKGGECPLQDQTIAYGPGESRFVEEKRHHAKPIPISENVYLDRERCILCDRCTRFAKEVAGDPLIHFTERGSNTEIATFPDDPFSSYFSGNTVQICPVGALTARPYRFKARPWDLVETESTCTSCSVGCRVSVHTSRDRVLRYQGVDVDPVNWGWLCDKGRFDFEAVHSDDRLGAPLVRGADGELAEVSWHEALTAAAGHLRSALDGAGAGSVAVIGGARLTNESAYAWAKLAKGVIGTDHVDAQLGDGLPAEVVLGLPRATIDDACTAGGTVLLLGTDAKEELPVLHLRLRHAVVSDGVKIIEVSPQATGITSHTFASIRHQPGDTAAVVAALLGGGAAPAGVDADALSRAREALGAGPLTVVVGRPSVAESAAGAVEAAAAVLAAHPDARFLSALRRANVHGALDLGLAPGILPGRVTLDEGRDWFTAHWGSVPAATGLDTAGILAAAAEGRIETLVLLGADPLADFPDADLARRGLEGAANVIAVDLFRTASSDAADVVLAAAGYAEVDGTTTNLEGRVSRVSQRVNPPGTARADWMIAAELAFRLGGDLGVESVEDVWDEIEQVSPAHAGLTLELLASDEATAGFVVPVPVEVEPAEVAEPAEDGDSSAEADAAPEAEAEASAESEADDAASDDADGESDDEAALAVEATPAPERPALLTFVAPAPAAAPAATDSYSLRLTVGRKLYDQGTLVAHSPSLANLAPAAVVHLSPKDHDRVGVGVAGVTEVRIRSAKGDVVVPAVADKALAAGTAALAFHQPGASAAALIDAGAAVTEVRIESVEGGAS
ncbi:MAG: NADH-quinone oxidoreductase subunit NuoG [Acidimicrobiales bacterium]|nr:NADH-quinone oxidoreductase subunit NuoG [Acidimicrobiales bacterium]